MSTTKGLELQRNYPKNKKFLEFFIGAWCMQAMWNSERQMNTAFMYGMSNTIDRLYPDPEDDEKRKAAYRRHLEFFNITPQFGAFTLGLAAAMEEQYAEDPENFDPAIINATKVALMGPLSGIGDSLFQGTIRIIAMSIGIQLAMNGSILGPLIALFISVITSVPITWYAGKLGYEGGHKFLESLTKTNIMDKLMYACSIIGLVVVGSMVASLVDMTTPLAYGDALQVQSLLDSICPKLIPLAITGIMYVLITKYKVKPMAVMLVCLFLGVVLKFFGIF